MSSLIAVRVTRELERRIKAKGSISTVVRAALEQYLEDEPKKEVLVKAKAPAKPKGARLPADWVLTVGYAKAAREIDETITEQEVRDIANAFRDYWVSVPGQKGVKLDWLATWRNWVRRDRKQKPKSFKTAQDRRAERSEELYDYEKAVRF